MIYLIPHSLGKLPFLCALWFAPESDLGHKWHDHSLQRWSLDNTISLRNPNSRVSWKRGAQKKRFFLHKTLNAKMIAIANDPLVKSSFRPWIDHWKFHDTIWTKKTSQYTISSTFVLPKVEFCWISLKNKIEIDRDLLLSYWSLFQKKGRLKVYPAKWLNIRRKTNIWHEINWRGNHLECLFSCCSSRKYWQKWGSLTQWLLKMTQHHNTLSDSKWKKKF